MSASAGLFIDAYDSLNNLLTSVHGGNYYYTDTFLSVSSGTSDIAYVKIHDDGGYFTIDDFSSPGVSGQPRGVPDGCSTLTLLGLATLAAGALKRRLASLN